MSATQNSIASGTAEENTKEDGLKRTIGFVGGSCLIVGGIIGSGIFITPTSILEGSGSIGVALVLWLISGVISTFGGLCFAELSTTIPESGGEYNYILESFGPVCAFVFIWTSIFVIKPAIVTIIAVSSSVYIAEAFFPRCHVPEMIYKLLGATIILSLTLINMVSVKWAIRLNTYLTYTKFVAILIFVGIGLANLRHQEARSYFSKPFEGTSVTAGSVGSALFQALWAYDGFNSLNYAAEEMINPDVNLPRSIIVGMITVTACYLAINICFIAAIGPDGILQTNALGLTIGYVFLGKFSWIIAVLVGISSVGSAISTVFGNGRLFLIAARKGHLPMILASTHKNLRTPVPSLAFTAIVSLVMLIPETSHLDKMINLFGFATWVFFLLCFLGQIYLRYKKPELRRPFKVWIVIPMLMCIFSLFLIILPIFEDAIGFGIACGIILLGLPFYLIFVVYKHKLPLGFYAYIEKVSMFIMNCYDLKVAENEKEIG